jgi:hypothetical protein
MMLVDDALLEKLLQATGKHSKSVQSTVQYIAISCTRHGGYHELGYALGVRVSPPVIPESEVGEPVGANANVLCV